MEKKKILILPGGLQIGGAERVAANISKYAPDDIFEFHYLVFDCHENVYGQEIEERGGKVITLPLPSCNYAAYVKSLASLIHEHRYAAVHSHTMFNSGINLLVAKVCGVPIRIAHSHTTRNEKRVSVAKKLYEIIMRQCIVLTATHYYACGVDAGKWLYGKKCFERNGFVLRNGIDTAAFGWSAQNRVKIREQYGLQNAFVIGHTGTLLQVKNQKFLIKCMPAVLKQKPNAVLMLVGSDENGEKKALQQYARDLGVNDRIIFCGPVLNVNEYLSAFDVFAFPSLREGTPLALLEAQTNGLPCIVSENIPMDAFQTDRIKALPLSAPERWVDSICRANREKPERYIEQIRRVGYDAQDSYRQIYETYLGKGQKRKAMVSLSFDDGRGDNTEIVDRLLLPRNIPVTLNITSGYIDGSCPAELLPSSKEPMQKEDVIRLASDPRVEIALHGHWHQNTPADILKGQKELSCWLGKKKDYKFGFASPRSNLHSEAWETGEYLELRNNLLYMRDSYRLQTFAPMRMLCRKAGRVIHAPFLFRIAYADSEMAFKDKQIVYSACILKDTTFSQVRALLEDCIRNNMSVTLMFHSILDDCRTEDAWSWEKKKFEELCDYLVQKRAEGMLDICTTRELFDRLQ